MDIQQLVVFLREFLVLILAFGALFTYALIRGTRALVALMLGLYFALLISLKFPYYERVFGIVGDGEEGNVFASIIIFSVFTSIGTFLFERLISNKLEGRAFGGVAKKLFFATLATVLVMAYSYHVLPITTLVEPGAAIDTLFAPESYFFWFLIAPLLGLFFV